MFIPLTDFYKSIVKETTSSFIFGTTSSFAKSAFNQTNLIYKGLLSIRKGAEQAEFTLAFNTLMFLTRFLRIRRKFAHGFCILVCTYVFSKKNGIVFAIRSCIITFLTNLIF